MKEIPISYVRTNQLILVGLTFSSIVMQNKWILLAAFIFVTLPLFLGAKANLAFQLAKRLPRKKTDDRTESVELQRFNQTIAATLLGVAVIIQFATGSWVAWIFVWMVTLAATIALLGYCVGCFFYFQLKKLKYKLSK